MEVVSMKNLLFSAAGIRRLRFRWLDCGSEYSCTIRTMILKQCVRNFIF